MYGIIATIILNILLYIEYINGLLRTALKVRIGIVQTEREINHMMDVHLCASVCVCLGYEGGNCEVDINECEQHPCDKGGKCFQRSNVLNYKTLPELSKANFSYDAAAGFICQCHLGFTGKFYSTNKNKVC